MGHHVPEAQTAALIENPGPNARVIIRDDIPVGIPGPDEILVKLSYSGLCGSEIRALLGWGSYNPIVGHEGVGVVVKAGQDVDASMIDKVVGVKWLYSACSQCSTCSAGFPNYCSKQSNTGRNVPGTLQQYVIADPRFVTEIPDKLPSHIAAPLLCGGLTMAGALSKLENELKPGDWVVISGSGGGLGHIGVQIAARLKRFRVIAVDSGESKRSLSLKSGAEAFVDFAKEDLEARVKEMTGEGAHAVIVVTGSKDAFAAAPKLVRNSGVIVCVGLPPVDFELPISATICAARGLVIKGAAVGTEEQMSDLISNAVSGIITPSVEVFDFSEVPNIIDKLKRDAITGRVVVKIPQ